MQRYEKPALEIYSIVDVVSTSDGITTGEIELPWQDAELHSAQETTSC